MPSPHGKQLRRAYGFDEVAIVPGQVTINPEQTDVSLRIGDLNLAIPFLAAAMDGVVDPRFAITFAKYGGLAVLNLEGLWSRYDNADDIIDEIVADGVGLSFGPDTLAEARNRGYRLATPGARRRMRKPRA